MSEEPILVEIKDGVCWITLNRPDKLNSIDSETMRRLYEVLDEVEDDQKVRCVVIRGSGRAFSAGADVDELMKLTPEEAEEISKKGHETMMKIYSMPKPVIAAINGYALGGGCELASACDIRIASEKAKFGQPEIKLGIIPGWGGTQLLARLIGVGRAMELILTGRIIDAEEAYRMGLVNKVVPHERLEEEVSELAKALASGAPIAMAEAKRLVNLCGSLEVGLDEEAKAFGRLFATEDSKEGFKAFKAKRTPSFKGV